MHGGMCVWYVHVWGVSDAGPLHMIVISQSDLSSQTGNPPAHPSIKLNYVECILPHKVVGNASPPPTATGPASQPPENPPQRVCTFTCLES